MNQKALYIPLCLLIVLTPTQSQHELGSLLLLGASLAGTCGTYRWLRKTSSFTPTLENTNTITARQVQPNTKQEAPILSLSQIVKQIHRGKTPPICTVVADQPQPSDKLLRIEKGVTTTSDDETIFIFSRGYAKTTKPGTNDNFIQKGACAVAAYEQINRNIVNNAPCITFDYPDNRRTFNFAQKTDIECLATVYRAIQERSPQAHIVLVGDCRGAKAALNFATTNPEQLKAVILMSPFLSVKELTKSIARNHLKKLPFGQQILHGVFKLWFPNYKEQNDQIFTALDGINPDIPILIGHRVGDALVANEQIEKLLATLKRNGHHKAHLLVSYDTSAPHSKLPEVETFQEGVNLFLKMHNFPHNPELAARGQELLCAPESALEKAACRNCTTLKDTKKASYFHPMCTTQWREQLALQFFKNSRLLSGDHFQFNPTIQSLLFT